MPRQGEGSCLFFFFFFIFTAPVLVSLSVNVGVEEVSLFFFFCRSGLPVISSSSLYHAVIHLQGMDNDEEKGRDGGEGCGCFLKYSTHQPSTATSNQIRSPVLIFFFFWLFLVPGHCRYTADKTKSTC